MRNPKKGVNHSRPAKQNQVEKMEHYQVVEVRKGHEVLDRATVKPLESSNVSPFNFEGHDVRVIADEDGEPWFVGSDVAAVLGYAAPDNAVRAHCKAAKTCSIKTVDQVRSMKVIPERDVYRLVMRSKLPSAERFEEWVVSEVLPSIRRTGRYQAPAATSANPLDLMQAMIDQMRGQDKRMAQIEAAQTEQHARVSDLVDFRDSFDERVAQATTRAPLAEKPAGAESMTWFKEYWNEKRGLPGWVVEAVLRQIKGYRVVPAAMVRNEHVIEEGLSARPYAVYQRSVVTAIMTRFVSECVRHPTAKCKATHHAIERPFNLDTAYGKTAKPVDAREAAEGANDTR